MPSRSPGAARTRSYCTYFDHRYLERGLAMIRSLRRYEPDAQVTVLCLTPQCGEILLKLRDPGVHPIALADFEQANPDLLAVKPTRSTLEYYFTLSGCLVASLVSDAPDGSIVTYLDADLLFYSSTAPIYDEIGDASVALVGHRYHWWKRNNIKFGRFNVSWTSFRADDTGRAAARWWRERCIEWCYDYIDGDRFADQKYLDRIIVEFPNVIEVTHPGANVAPWNLGRHKVSKTPAGELRVDRDWPLIFFHFQGLREVEPGLFLANHLPYLAPFSKVVRTALYEPYVGLLARIAEEVRPLSPEIAASLPRGSADSTTSLKQRLFEMRARMLKTAARWAGHFVSTRILFIGPLPEPIMGQAVACQVFLDSLRPKHHVDVIDLNKAGLSATTAFFGRIREVMQIVFDAGAKSRTAGCIYMNISQSPSGNLKDLLIYIACFRKLSRTAIHLHGGTGMRELFASSRPLTRLANAFFLNRIGGVIVLSPRHANIFDRIAPAHTIRVVPNFADESLYLDDSSIRQKYSDTTPLRLLFLSNMIPGKGHYELVEAYRTLAPEMQRSVSIDFAGEFESSAQRVAFLATIAPFPALQYHGVVRGHAKKALLHAAHLFCLPTYYRYEGLPLSILEAYASGCAVMTTDHGAIFDAFTPGRNGYLVDKRSAASIRQAIENAVLEPSALEIMAANNRSDAQLYPTEKYNRSLTEILDELIRS